MMMLARSALLLVLAVTVAGCGSSARSMLERQDSDVQASANPSLSMPPDLRLPQPGSAPPPQPAPAYGADGNVTSSATVAERPKYGDDIYAQAGISTFKPDGTRKSDQELQQELREYYLAKKRQKNQNYGTIFNIGNVFSDE